MHCLLKSFSHYIDQLLSVSSFADGCINGIQVEGKSSIAHVATSVSATLKSIQKAKRIGADVLIVHHGLFLKGKDLVIQDSMREKLKILLEENITLLTYHLPLDAHMELGNNWPAAKLLDFFDLEPFGLFGGKYIGVKGRCAPTTAALLKKKLEHFYGRKADVALFGPKNIETFALVSGSGHKLLMDAVHDEVDCLITGTSDEPVWFQAREEKIHFYALGHSATEKLGVQLLGEHLAEEFELKHTFIDDDNQF